MPTVRYTVIDGEVIAEKRNGVRRLYVPDPLGSTVALADNTQTITDRFSYWPYGEEVSRTGTTPTPFRFVGTQGYHRDTPNRTYVRARVLRPDMGRWMTADPLGIEGGDLSLYQYAQARPTVWLDPGGRLALPWWIVIAIGAWQAACLAGAGLSTLPITLCPSYTGRDKLAHCIAACVLSRCGFRPTAWLWGLAKEYIWDVIKREGPDRQDLCANNRGEWCARQVQAAQCDKCCLAIYPPPANVHCFNMRRGWCPPPGVTLPTPSCPER